MSKRLQEAREEIRRILDRPPEIKVARNQSNRSYIQRKKSKPTGQLKGRKDDGD